MDKKEARIKCHGCGTSYKLKVPVSDKPVNFTCKKCGKVLKIKLKPGPEAGERAAAAHAAAPPPGIETGKQPDAPELDFGEVDFGAEKAPEAPAAKPPQFGAPAFDDEGPPQFEDGAPQAARPPGLESTKHLEFEDDGPELDFSEPADLETSKMPEFERTQLPEDGGYHDKQIPEPAKAASRPAEVPTQGAPGGPPVTDKDRKWLMLDEDLIRGPFSDDEIVQMIRQEEVNPETSLRMGERPWIKAGEISQFRRIFYGDRAGGAPDLEPFSLFDEEEQQAPVGAGKPFYADLGALVSYPMGTGNPVPLGIFAGIGFVLSSILSGVFSLTQSWEFLGAVVVNFIGWAILYGYLTGLMDTSMQSPTAPPPGWDFSRALEMLVGGGLVLVVLLVYSLIPTIICLLLMIFFFLGKDALLGYVFMTLTVLVYLGSLFLVPGALVLLVATGKFASALNPMKVSALIKGSGKSYLMLGVVSMGAGLTCLLITLCAALLAGEIPMVGFVVAGLLMAVVFAYAHFVWFHTLGRFSMENRKLTSQVS